MEIFNFQIKKDTLSFEEINQFLQKVEKDFTPPLFERINVVDYYLKIKKNAEVIVCREGEAIVGVLIFYCNNNNTKIAYVTLLAVDSEYRGKGIASHLLDMACIFSKEKKMEKIGIHTNNYGAYLCYKKNGFEEIENTPLSSGLIRYYLEKKI